MPASPADWLVPLRHRFASLFEELGIRCEWVAPALWPARPSVAQCAALTRVDEEALINVIKHSRAQSLRIQVAKPETQWMTVQVCDDGMGCNLSATDSPVSVMLQKPSFAYADC